MNGYRKCGIFISGILFSPLKRPLKSVPSTTCNNVNGPARDYAKWNKPVTEWQMLHDSTLHETFVIVKFIEENRMVVSSGCGGGGNRELFFNRYKFTVTQDE